MLCTRIHLPVLAIRFSVHMLQWLNVRVCVHRSMIDPSSMVRRSVREMTNFTQMSSRVSLKQIYEFRD